tara:strand:+ start:280 stop:474 length:195 start_codon:yes stop_codon:yes gene_type:complete
MSYVLIEKGVVISEEGCLGNAAELQMVLEEMGRKVTIMEEGLYWNQMSEIAEMQQAAESGVSLI